MLWSVIRCLWRWMKWNPWSALWSWGVLSKDTLHIQGTFWLVANWKPFRPWNQQTLQTFSKAFQQSILSSLQTGECWCDAGLRWQAWFLISSFHAAIDTLVIWFLHLWYQFVRCERWLQVTWNVSIALFHGNCFQHHTEWQVRCMGRRLPVASIWICGLLIAINYSLLCTALRLWAYWFRFESACAEFLKARETLFKCKWNAETGTTLIPLNWNAETGRTSKIETMNRRWMSGHTYWPLTYMHKFL